jgi:hypothetical protein
LKENTEIIRKLEKNLDIKSNSKTSKFAANRVKGNQEKASAISIVKNN